MDERPQQQEQIEQGVGNGLVHIGTGDYFMNRTPIAKALRITTINVSV